jgi:diguanylate cyclase
MPLSSDWDAQPGWLRWLKHRVLRQSIGRSAVWLTLLVMLLALLISQAVISVFGQGNRLIAVISAILSSLLLTPVIGIAVLRLVFALEDARRKLGLLATQDELTGASNRRHFMAVAQREWDRARRYNTTAALLLIDADHFKHVNDKYGHLCGDELLRQIACAAAASLRQVDVLARFGGEEFIVFLPHTDPLGALDAAERIRSQVQELRLAWNGAEVGTTVSIGVATLRPDLLSFEWMIHEADTALYAAKAQGRNCVRCLPLPTSRNGDTRPAHLS